MKFLHTFLFLICLPFFCSSQSNLIKLATNNIPGTSISLITIPEDDTQTTISVDWGNGTAVDATLTGYNSYRKITGNVLGDTIRIYTALSKFDCEDKKVTFLECKMSSLKELICGKNQFTHYNFDISQSLNLERFDIHLNKAIQFLPLMNHTKLKTVDAYNWDNDKGSITTILLPSTNCDLERLTIYGNDVSHLDITHCPKLTSLNANYNSLMDLDVTKNPKMLYLSLDYNMISELDLSKNTLLEQITLNNNGLTNINFYFNPQLVKIGVSQNLLKELHVDNLAHLTDLSCSDNQIKTIDLSTLPLLYRFSCDNNGLDALDLRHNPILKKLYCKGNNITCLNLIGNTNLTYLDLQNNAQMTPQAWDYTFLHLMSGLENSSPYPNLLLTGSNAEHANTNVAKDVRFNPDINGDGTAPRVIANITRIPSNNGTFQLQVPTEWDTNLRLWSHDTIAVGTPIHVVATPNDGYRVESILVNGQNINNTICSATSNAISIEVRFTLNPENVYFTLNSPISTQMEFTVSYKEDSEISVDWGDGTEIPMNIVAGQRTFLKGKVKGTVKVKGYTDLVDLANNDITSVDFSNNPLLTNINVYWTGITALDVSHQTELEKLDCAFNEINTLDVSNNTKLSTLICYSCNLSTLNLSAQTQLKELFAKGNTFASIDLSHNNLLRRLDLHDCTLPTIDVSNLDSLRQFQCSMNQLKTIDVSNNLKLSHFICSNNQLTTLDLENCPDLQILYCSSNLLPTLDVSHNTKMTQIMCENSGLKNLDLSQCTALTSLNLGGNGMTACELNTLYYHLPYNSNPPAGINFYNSNSTKTNACEKSESQIAVRKNWSIAVQGDASGCETAFITILKPINGTIQVLDAQNNSIKSGDVVTKGQDITIVATPNKDFKVSKLFQNGVKIVNKSFKLQMSTTIEVEFTNNTALTEASTNTSIWSEKNQLHIASTEASSISVYSLDGICLYSQTIRGEASIELPKGIYLVQVKQQDQTQLHKIQL